MGNPRIAEADRLIVEDLLTHNMTGEWVRTSAYDNGHRVSANGRDAFCGTILVYDEYWWEQVQEWATKWSHYKNRAKGPGKWSPTEYYLARDQRKGNKCTVCKKGVDLMEDTSPDRETSQHREVSDVREAYDSRPFENPTPAERLQRQRFLSKVSWVARELGAEVVDSTSEAA